MKKHTESKASPNILVLMKIWLIGVLCAESFYFSQIVASKVYGYINLSPHKTYLLISTVLYLIFVLIYIFYRNSGADFLKIVKSKRIDLAMIFITGIVTSIFLGGIGKPLYQAVVSTLTIHQLLILVVLPLFIILTVWIRAIQVWLISRKKDNAPFFLSDSEKVSKDEDLLDLAESSERFAERIFNQGSSESLVFGVDGPWGVGKTTFINFCKNYWEEKYKDQVLVYIFNPLKYENRENLLEKFIDGLTNTIQKQTFTPEIKPIISRYAQYIRSIKGSIFGFLNIELLGGSYTADDAFKDLEVALTSIDKKIIVIVDDLDRLNLSAVKDLLFTIKKSFTLPNVSYVLCYDAENINALEDKKPDLEKVTEFLEKFVNVKVSLYLRSDKLSNYVTANLETSLTGNSQADPILVSKAIGGLKDIFNSNDFYQYVSFIGDIRKIKRLINTVLLLDIEKTDFDNSDINNQDLIHLLLIYINYPNIFRKIYNTETAGKKGFFSLVSMYEDGYPKTDGNNPHFNESDYKNSVKYSDYIKTVSDNQKFLLNKIFEVSQRLEVMNAGSVSAEVRASLACFNGDLWSGGGRNLEDYLNLIVESSKPQTTGQYKFYLNQKNRLMEGELIETILSNEAFSYEKNENNHKQLWKIIVNSAHDFSAETGSKLISYLSDNIIKYSILEDEEIGLGLRHDLSFYIVKLLDQAGWVDENGTHRSNFDENLSEIVEWVFGEKRHNKAGVIQILSQEDRGILGFFDLLSFRLFCSADRGGNVFNLTRALAKDGNPNAPVDGATRIIAIEEMRKISQKVFEVFKKRYINKKINIFDIIDELSLVDLTSKYHKFTKSKIKSGELKEPDERLRELRSRIKLFTIYQLGSASIDHGIPCGYYDASGSEDKKEIYNEMNDYLFNICFYPGKKKDNLKNYEHFLDYLLMNFVSVFEPVKGRNYIANINQFTKVLDKERLRKYWNDNESVIKKLNLTMSDKSVLTGNYKAFYSKDLEDVYKALDELTLSTESPPAEGVTSTEEVTEEKKVS